MDKLTKSIQKEVPWYIIFVDDIVLLMKLNMKLMLS